MTAESTTARRIFRIDTGIRHAVEPGQGFPPLMQDTRDNNLANITLEGGEKIFLKAIAGPYVGTDGVHMMILPDPEYGKGIPENETTVKGVQDVSTEVLSESIELASTVAGHALEEQQIDEVNIGIHAASDWVRGPKQKTKNFPHMHIHVEAANYDSKPAITEYELRVNKDYYGKTGEPFERLGEQLLEHQILPSLKQEGFPIDELFEETRDDQSRFRLKLRQGKETFKDERLAAIMQAIDIKGQQAYDEIAECFFETGEDGKPVLDAGQYQRFKLLPRTEREERIKEYIQSKPKLSGGVKAGLTLVASIAKPAEEVIERQLKAAADRKGEGLTDEERKTVTTQAANRFMAFNGFSYATVFSARKNGDPSNPEWTLGFRPSVLIVEGFVNMAPTYGIIVKHMDQPYTPSELEAVQARERRIIEKTQQDMPNLQKGPGLENGI